MTSTGKRGALGGQWNRVQRIVAVLVLTVLLCLNIRTLGMAFERAYASLQSTLAEFEMAAIRDSLAVSFEGDRRLPDNDLEFERFVRTHFESGGERSPTRDRFGGAYQFEVLWGFGGKADGFRISSAGGDRQWRTSDDLHVQWRRPR